MPAYRLPMQLKCGEGLCDKRAKYQVFDKWNHERGYYCDKHADWRVTDMNKSYAKHPNDGKVAPTQIKTDWDE